MATSRADVTPEMAEAEYQRRQKLKTASSKVTPEMAQAEYERRQKLAPKEEKTFLDQQPSDTNLKTLLDREVANSQRAKASLLQSPSTVLGNALSGLKEGARNTGQAARQAYYDTEAGYNLGGHETQESADKYRQQVEQQQAAYKQTPQGQDYLAQHLQEQLQPKNLALNLGLAGASKVASPLVEALAPYAKKLGSSISDAASRAFHGISELGENIHERPRRETPVTQEGEFIARGEQPAAENMQAVPQPNTEFEQLKPYPEPKRMERQPIEAPQLPEVPEVPEPIDVHGMTEALAQHLAGGDYSRAAGDKAFADLAKDRLEGAKEESGAHNNYVKETANDIKSIYQPYDPLTSTRLDEHAIMNNRLESLNDKSPAIKAFKKEPNYQNAFNVKSRLGVMLDTLRDPLYKDIDKATKISEIKNIRDDIDKQMDDSLARRDLTSNETLLPKKKQATDMYRENAGHWLDPKFSEVSLKHGKNYIENTQELLKNPDKNNIPELGILSNENKIIQEMSQSLKHKMIANAIDVEKLKHDPEAFLKKGYEMLRDENHGKMATRETRGYFDNLSHALEENKIREGDRVAAEKLTKQRIKAQTDYEKSVKQRAEAEEKDRIAAENKAANNKVTFENKEITARNIAKRQANAAANREVIRSAAEQRQIEREAAAAMKKMTGKIDAVVSFVVKKFGIAPAAAYKLAKRIGKT